MGKEKIEEISVIVAGLRERSCRFYDRSDLIIGIALAARSLIEESIVVRRLSCFSGTSSHCGDHHAADRNYFSFIRLVDACEEHIMSLGGIAIASCHGRFTDRHEEKSR